MRPLVYLKVLGPSEHLAASRERARERFLAGVHPDVIDELVFGLERPAVPRAPLPEARVRGALGSAHVFYGKVRHNIVEGVKEFAAQLPSGTWGILVNPHTGHLLALSASDAATVATSTGGSVASHVPEKRAMGVVARMTNRGMLLVVDGSWR